LLLLLPTAVFANPIVVAVLGDSLTQGYGLNQEDGFVPQLETWVGNHGGDVSMINAGVSGDTTAGGLARIEWTLTPDVNALIIALGGNDLLRGIDPENSLTNLTGILSVAAQNNLPVLLIGLPAPSNYGPDYQQRFDAIFPALADKFDTVFYPSFLNALAKSTDPNSLDLKYMQADYLHPNPQGVLRIVDEIGPKVLLLIEKTKRN
jgi:acyl-CoA thioesterase-1